MDERAKFMAAMVAVPALVTLALIGFQMHFYIPSNRLAEAARDTRYSADARAEMVRTLRYCRRRGSTWFRAADIGVRYHQITSWRNDAGWLGQTEIHCADGQACTVTASAWIAAPTAGSGCGIASWLDDRH